MYTSEKVKQIANGFITGAERCMEIRTKSDGTFESALIAGVVCKAFSIELLFKAALLKERGEPVHGHELKKLYDDLSDESKLRLQRTLSLEQDSLEQKIDAVSKAFVKWRYIFESETTDLDINFLNSLASAAQLLTD